MAYLGSTLHLKLSAFWDYLSKEHNEIHIGYFKIPG